MIGFSSDDLMVVLQHVKVLLILAGIYGIYCYWNRKEARPYVCLCKYEERWVVSTSYKPLQFEHVLGPYPSYLDAAQVCQQLNTIPLMEERDHPHDDGDNDVM